MGREGRWDKRKEERRSEEEAWEVRIKEGAKREKGEMGDME